MKTFLQKKIFLGFAANIIVVLLLGWVSYMAIENYKKLRMLESQVEKIMFHAEKIKSVIHRIENDSKGYIITGHEKYLDTYNRNVFSIGRELEFLSVLFANSNQLKNIAGLEALIDRKIKYNNRFIELRRQKGSMDKISIPVTEDIETTNKIDQMIVNLQNQGELLFQSEKMKNKTLFKNLEIAFYILFLLTILLLGTVYFIIRYHLKRRKAAESLLEQNRQLLQSVIDNTTNPIFIKKINGQYLLINKRFERLFHYTNEEIKGKTDHQIFDKETADNLRSSDIDVVKAEKEIKTEEKIPHNGELHTYLMVKFPIRDEEDKIYAIGAIATEITEQKKIDIQIKKSEEQISGIFDAAPEAVIVINEEGNITKWNNKAEILFGWKINEVLGKPMHEIIMPSRYREAHLKGLKHFLKTGVGRILNKTVELSALNKENKEFDIELTVSFIDQEGKYFFIAFLRDISRKKQMEREIKRSQLFLYSVVENIPDMIFVKDATELRFVSLNTAGEKLLGYSAKDLIGKNDYNFFPKEQADFFTNKDREVLRSEGVLDIPEEIVDTKNGKRWLHTKKITIRDEKGNPVYLLGISEDITEKKQLEDEKNEAERLMRENEQRMILILENIGEGVVVADPQQKILLANRMAEEILKISEESGPFDWTVRYNIFYPDGHTIFPSQNLPLEKALRGEATDDMELVVVSLITKERKRISVTGRPIKDKSNEIIAAVATIKDITKYRAMEKALHESEKKYRNLIGFKRSDSEQ